MTFEIYITFVVASMVLIAIPGPTVLTITSHSITYGVTHSLKTISGAAFAHFSFVGITAFGVGELLLMSHKYFIILKWIGIVYLLTLGGYKLFKRKKTSKTKIRRWKTPLFIQGFLITISNPKSILFYAAFFPPFLNPELELLPQYLILGSTFIGIFYMLSIVSASLAHYAGKNLFNKNDFVLEKVSGGIMIVAGLLLASIKSGSR